ncbi:pentapeptide repeat-containing protein [Amycolatopsis balhimycina DSM 5908]|uniref:Pentapeptide repeat-containing protein n=2 Tax=Amycolatopsis balhimycina TaxID=208443 RepID=A0A428WHU3_AMYBA|nr:pentapeptide repeat-containing protein [Amycolatopsis balhimycina DSM 5908]
MGQRFSWWWVGCFLTASATAGVVFAVVLWGDTTADHRNALDTSWKVAAAVLAILAALVTVRRLRLGEDEHRRQIVADAAKEAVDHATLVANLSSKASEQLGSDKAAVRIGGLTDLERLAQNYPDLRQTVVDRICAYLRAPYRPPADYSAETLDEALASGAEEAESRLELDVRRTAQKILSRHLYWPQGDDKPTSFWELRSLDLRDASLVEVNFARCRLPEVDFRGASFYGKSYFDEATFGDLAWFDRLVFNDPVTFVGAAFEDHALFSEVDFLQEVDFGHVDFLKSVRFNETSFGYRCVFSGVKFVEAAWFMSAMFRGRVEFDGATFAGAALFGHAVFGGRVDFGFVKFCNVADFDDAAFRSVARFTETTFNSEARFRGAAFKAAANFGSAIFRGSVNFSGASFAIEPGLEGAIISDSKVRHAWPSGWRVRWGEGVPDDRGWLTKV